MIKHVLLWFVIVTIVLGNTLSALPPLRVGTVWQDSIGERIRDSDDRYALPIGALLFHSSVWLDFTKDKNKWYSLDLAQSIMHNRNMTDGGKQPVPEYFAVHVFRVKKAIELTLINPYSTTFSAIKALNSGVDPMGQRPEVTETLVENVCKISHGWRNPWDQDEVMLCNGNNGNDSLTYVGTMQIRQTTQNLKLRKNSSSGSEVTIAPLFGGQNGVYSFAIRDFLSGTALSQASYFTSSGAPVNINDYFWPRFYTIYHNMCSEHIKDDYNDCGLTVDTTLRGIADHFSRSDIAIYIAQILDRFDCGFAKSQSTFPYFGSLKLLEKTPQFQDNLNTPHHVDLTCTPK